MDIGKQRRVIEVEPQPVRRQPARKGPAPAAPEITPAPDREKKTAPD